VGCAADCSYGAGRPRSANSNEIGSDVMRNREPHAESTASLDLLLLTDVLMSRCDSCAPLGLPAHRKCGTGFGRNSSSLHPAGWRNLV
jgi:hypothetical protein